MLRRGASVLPLSSLHRAHWTIRYKRKGHNVVPQFLAAAATSDQQDQWQVARCGCQMRLPLFLVWGRLVLPVQRSLPMMQQWHHLARHKGFQIPVRTTNLGIKEALTPEDAALFYVCGFSSNNAKQGFLLWSHTNAQISLDFNETPHNFINRLPP